MVLSASINPNGRATTWWFIWGASTNYGQATAAQAMGTNSYFTTFYQTITGLSAGVTYYHRAVASNDLGQVVLGDEQQIVLAAPGVATYSVDRLAPTYARLDGVGYPNGLPTHGWFEWGLTPAFGQATPIILLGGSSLHIGNDELFGLQSSTAYYYRAVASNSVAVVYGATQHFVTPDSNTCANGIGPADISRGYGAMSGTVWVSAPTNCSWNMVNTNSWITILSGANGIGSGDVAYILDPNPDILPRIGNLKIAGWNLELTQFGYSIAALPVDQVVVLGGTATFSVTVSDIYITPPFTYQWQFNGVDLVNGGGISGATTANLVLTDVQYSEAGHYRCLLRNAFGSTFYGSSATLTVAPVANALPIAEAVDTEYMFFWKTWSDSPGIWFGQTNTTHDGIDALECSGLAAGEFASFETKSGGPGLLSFWWKSAFAAPSDRLSLSIGSSQSAVLTNTTDWEQRSFTVPPGDVNLRWTFSNSSTGEQSRAWVDQAQFSPCNFSLSPGYNYYPSVIINSLVYTGKVTVTAAADCPWHVVNTNSWITILSSVTNHGSGSVTYVATANTTGANRFGYLTIADHAYSIRQGYGAPTAGISLAAALDTEGTHDWSTIGTPAWFGQNIVSRDGADAAQSGQIGDSNAVTATITVNGPGAVFFWWKVSSETNKDYLKFFINGVQQTRISGETDWQLLNYNLFSGTNMLKWTYSKNGSVAVGQDRGWLDQVQFVPTPETGLCALAISPISASHSSNSETGSVHIVTAAGCGWDVVNTNSWITYSVDSGVSNGVVRYTVSANNSSDQRTGVILIGGRPFTVTQSSVTPSCSYSLWPTGHAFGTGGGASFTITAQAGCPWSVINTNDWINIWSGAIGSDSGVVNYVVGENTNSFARSGNIRVGNQLYFVSQTAAPIMTLAEALDTIGSSLVWLTTGGGSWFGQFGVNHDGVDAAHSGPVTQPDISSWLSTSVTGPGTLTFWWKVSSETNSDWLRFYLDGSQQTAISGEVSWQQQTVTIPAGTHNLSWNYWNDGSGVGQDCGWLDQVQFVPSAGCAFTLSPGHASHPSTNSTGGFSVVATTGCAWSVLNTNSWISIMSGSNGIGNGTVIYSVVANPTASVRSGYLRVADKTLLVTQAGSGTNPPPPCTISLSPGSRSHGSGSATGTVSVTTQSGCAWSVTETNSWISILSSLNNSSSGTVVYSLAPNTNSQTRSGFVRIADRNFIVTQSGTSMPPTNAPRIQFVGLTTNSSLLSVQGEAGRMYVVECSEDFINWRPISTNCAPDTFIDPAVGTAPKRFYRTVEIR
jgi:hypothetical protein